MSTSVIWDPTHKVVARINDYAFWVNMVLGVKQDLKNWAIDSKVTFKGRHPSSKLCLGEAILHIFPKLRDPVFLLHITWWQVEWNKAMSRVPLTDKKVESLTTPRLMCWQALLLSQIQPWLSAKRKAGRQWHSFYLALIVPSEMLISLPIFLRSPKSLLEHTLSLSAWLWVNHI